jgi:hypothetical protein
VGVHKLKRGLNPVDPPEDRMSAPRGLPQARWPAGLSQIVVKTTEGDACEPHRTGQKSGVAGALREGRPSRKRTKERSQASVYHGKVSAPEPIPFIGGSGNEARAEMISVRKRRHRLDQLRQSRIHRARKLSLFVFAEVEHAHRP